jgi:hypothetical protein
MDNDFWKWFVGMLVTGAGMLGVQTRWLQSAIQRNTEAIRRGDDALHERVNRVREELAKDFVRKADIDAHLSRVDETYRDLRTEMREGMKDIADRLDVVISRRPAARRRKV